MNRLKLDGMYVGEVKPKNTGKQCSTNAGKFRATVASALALV